MNRADANNKTLCPRALIGAALGCVLLFSAPTQAAKENVAIVSIIGNNFTSVSVAGTAFNIDKHTAKVKPWQIDRFVTTTIEDILAESKSLRVKNIRIKRKPLAKIYDTSKHGFLEEGDYDLDQIADVMPRLRDKQIDKLILVIASKLYDPLLDANTEFRGYGMYLNTAFIEKYFLYAYFKILIINTADNELQHEEDILAYRPIAKKRWAFDLGQTSEAHKRGVRNALKRMMTENIAVALANAGVIAPSLVRKRQETEKAGKRKKGIKGMRISATDEYVQAIKRAYLALDMRRVFERYAREWVGGNTELYADTIRDWVDDRFGWNKVRRPLVLMYSRLGLSADEINDLADLAEGSSAPPTREEMQSLRGIWDALADRAARRSLRQAIKQRRQLIIREGERLRQ